jgi:lipid-binding SYLF domain-containing protein
MKTFAGLIAVLVLVTLCSLSSSLLAQPPEAAMVERASQLMDAAMAYPPKCLPRAVLLNAHGIAVFPRVVTEGVLFNVEHGHGAIVIRGESGQWHPPILADLSGETLSLQAGVYKSDLILIFRTKNSADEVLRGKYGVASKLSAVPGPVGFAAGMTAEVGVRAEIFAYTYHHGQCTGVTLDTTSLRIDARGNDRFYEGTGIHPAEIQPELLSRLPPSAARLLMTMDRYAQAQVAAPVPAPTVWSPPAAAPVDVRGLQRQLAESAIRLQPLLDATWRSYLALPAEVYTADRVASPEALQQTLDRFKMLYGNPAYQELVRRPEFQQTFNLLRQCIVAQPLPRGPAFPPPYQPQ